MKSVIALIAILAIFSVQASKINIRDDGMLKTREVEGVTFNNYQKWHYPRADQSCSEPVDQSDLFEGVVDVIGWYWNDQQCVPCAHPYCKCTKYRECDSCLEGFAKVIESSPYNSFLDKRFNTCYECPKQSTSGYMENLGGSKDTGFFGSNGQYEVTDCEVFYNTDLDSKYFDKRFDNMENYKLWTQGFRANKCNPGSDKHNVKVVQYGSICWYSVGCKSYNKYGKCNTCYDGYFLNEEQYCEECRSTCEESISYDGKITYDKCKTTGGCEQCSSRDTCTKCKEGYWNAGPIFFNRDQANERIDRKETQLETLLDFNACVQCPSGCSCKLRTGLSQFKFTSFDTEPLDGYYKQNEKCTLCSDTLTACDTCGFEDIKLKCAECKPEFKGKFYLTTPLDDGTCKVCPENCYECKLIDGFASCLPNKCFNGFRPKRKQEDNVSITECVPCEGANAARCKTVQDKEVITQCDTAVSQTEDNQDYDTEALRNGQRPVPRMNFNPPNTGDFLLIPEAEGSAFNKCIQNIYECKVMALDQTCTECYTEQGYYLNSNKHCKKLSDLANLDNCRQKKEKQNECEICFDGYELIRTAEGANTFSCQKCTESLANCSECSNNGGNFQCTKCNPGYTLKGTECVACNVQNCAECDDDINGCKSCMERFVLWNEALTKNEELAKEQNNFICETCEPGCLTCETRKVCTKCQDDLYLHGGVCHERLANCIQFDGSSEGSHKCKWCKYGYRLTGDGVCVRCFSPDLGAIHCHTECEGDTCWYSTVNDLNLLGEDDTQ